MARKSPFSLDQQDAIRDALHEGWVSASMDVRGVVKLTKHRFYDPRAKDMEPEITRMVAKNDEDPLGFLYNFLRIEDAKCIIYLKDAVPVLMDEIKQVKKANMERLISVMANKAPAV